MRISDWSSDVCSSDLVQRLVRRSAAPQELAHPASAPLHRQLRSPEQLPFPSAHQSGAVPRSDARAPRHLSAFRDMTREDCKTDGGPLQDEHLRPLDRRPRSEEHTSELQSLMRISYAVFCLKKKKKHTK